MRQSGLVIALLLAGITLPALAQPPAPPPPRAKGPALDLAVEAAQLAIKTCLANGYKTSALVTDSAGLTVALLSADGVGIRTQEIAAHKAATVIRYKVASGVIADRIKAEPALAEEVKADPRIAGFAWRGALPIMAGAEQIGAIAVSGAPGGEKDEACAQPALAAIAGRLK